MDPQFYEIFYNDYYRNVSRGIVKDSSPVVGFGRIVTTGAASGILWPNGIYNIPVQAGEYFEIVSTDANDGPGGTGIRSVHVHVLDANLDQIDILVNLNGITPVLVPTTIRFIECMHIATWGSLKAAAGTIYARRIGTTDNFSVINIGENRCSSSVRMCPRGKRLLAVGGVGSSTSGTAAAGTEIQMVTSFIGGHDYTYPDLLWIPQMGVGTQDSSIGMIFPVSLVATEGQLIGMTYDVNKAAVINGTWFGVIEPLQV